MKPSRSIALKNLAWAALDRGVRFARAIAGGCGATRRVDAIVYKVDRLGDWLLAQPAVTRIVAEARARGGRVVVWASRESAGLRALCGVDCPVEVVVFEPKSGWARARRTWAVIRLLAIYRADTVYCLRHGPDPVRDFVLRNVAAKNVFALSWRIAAARRDSVPQEIRRHEWILRAAGLEPDAPEALLPRLSTAPDTAEPRDRVVVAPFSSAPVKDWPDTSWCELAAKWDSRRGAWELWVSPDQLARAHSLAGALKRAAGARAPDVRVKSGSLADLVQAIGSARLVLSVDTLAAHLAVALDVPLVALLGGGQYGDFAPWSRSERQRWVSHRLPCYHCNWQCTRARNECLCLIAPDAVLAEIDAVAPRVTTMSSAISIS